MHRLSMRGSGKPLVHRTTFIGLEVTKTEPAQSLERDNLCDRFRDQRKHLPQPAVEEQRFIANDQKVIEREPGPACALRQENRHAMNSCRDFVSSDVHRRSCPCIDVEIAVTNLWSQNGGCVRVTR
jgi:hypothetical protein